MSPATNLEELRRKRKRDGVQYIELSDELTIGVHIVGLEMLIAQGKIPNPLLKLAMDLNKKAGEGLASEEILQSIEFMDVLCSAVIVDPPWCLVKDTTDGATPEGKLCLADLSDDERNCIFKLVYGGFAEYETFRKEQRSNATVQNSDSIRETSDELVVLVTPGSGIHPLLD